MLTQRHNKGPKTLQQLWENREMGFCREFEHVLVVVGCGFTSQKIIQREKTVDKLNGNGENKEKDQLLAMYRSTNVAKNVGIVYLNGRFIPIAPQHAHH